jgi:hypothetical protein
MTTMDNYSYNDDDDVCDVLGIKFKRMFALNLKKAMKQM